MNWYRDVGGPCFECLGSILDFRGDVVLGYKAQAAAFAVEGEGRAPHGTKKAASADEQKRDGKNNATYVFR
jgi:hypothetical protein